MRLAVDVPGQVLGRPAQLEQHLLEVPALRRVHHHGVLVDPGADQPLTLALRSTSVSTGRSVVTSTSPWVGCFSIRSRPYRSIVSATSTSSPLGTG